MTKWFSIRPVLWMLALAIVFSALPAGAIDQAMPADHPSIGPAPGEAAGSAMTLPPSAPMTLQNREAFQAQIKLDQFRLLAIENKDQLKIIDSWARQSLKRISGRESWQGQDPVYTALDMMIRPQAWYDENIVFVQAVPIREQLTEFAEGDTPLVRAADARRILEKGMVSPRFLDRPEVQQKLQQIGQDVRQLQAVNKINLAVEDDLANLFIKFDIAPPGAADRSAPWLQPARLAANTISPAERAKLKVSPIAGYTDAQARRVISSLQDLIAGWQTNDAAKANQGIAGLVSVLPTIDPPGYPSSAKRITELWYNRTFYGTVANVFLYFIAMVLFLLVAVGVSQKLWKTGYLIFSLAVVLHIVSMGVRMWLAGRWPTQNQFESVLGAALLGCVVGWLLETWKRNGLFGMAFSFVGFLAMTACMAAPYMFGTDLGGAISKTAGILQTYWLYIHVNIVISSYALISATFVLGVLYLLIRQWYWINPLEAGGEGEDPGGPGSLAPSGAPGAMPMATGLSRARVNQLEALRADTLSKLDQANMVILQMAFWFLGIGIICGAVWADHSWGRPWGWDPKETFALITWIVYLIIVHVRIVAPRARADTTAWLSIAGFGVMMFNWIGVNFFLAGLHSYA